MGVLPIPGEIYINDFPDKALYTVSRGNSVVGKFDGLPNKDEGGKHIAFLFGSNVQVGDVVAADYDKPVQIKSTEIDTFEGKPEIIRAYY